VQFGFGWYADLGFGFGDIGLGLGCGFMVSGLQVYGTQLLSSHFGMYWAH